MLLLHHTLAPNVYCTFFFGVTKRLLFDFLLGVGVLINDLFTQRGVTCTGDLSMLGLKNRYKDIHVFHFFFEKKSVFNMPNS